MIQTVPYPLYIGPLTIAGKTAPNPDSLATGRESAVWCLEDGSREVLRALPIGFLGGKARWDDMQRALEGMSALCLHGSSEGKRGMVSWK